MALDNFRKKNPKYLGVSMTYAGRLDPMATGVLVILTGKKIKDKEKYLALDKSYNFSVLFGFSTDTYDILGKVSAVNYDVAKQHVSVQSFATELKRNLAHFKGKLKQKYPMYSSKTVNGKPLFSYARNGKNVEIPERDIIIKKIVLEKVSKISNSKLFSNIERRIKRVAGDFRQKEILKIWKNKLLLKRGERLFYIADFKIECGSGTYVRQVANTLGVKMGIPAVAFSIRRTKVGRFK